MQSPGEVGDVKKKIHVTARKMLEHRIRTYVWASGSGREKVGGSRKNFSGRANERVRLFKARGWAELRKVVSGSAMQGLWLRNRKVGAQVSGID